MFSLAVSSAKINGKSEDEIQSLALAQKHFEYLKSDSCDILDSDSDFDYDEIDGDELDSDSFDSDANLREKKYTIDGYILTETVASIEKYEVSGNTGSNPVIPEKNIINIELKKEKGKYILYASNISESINYKVKSNCKIKISYKNNAVNFENNGNGPSIEVDQNSDVKINYINNTGNNFEVSFNNQNYIKHTDEIYIYYTIGNNITIKKDSDGVMEYNDSNGEIGLYNNFIMYKIIVNVSKGGNIYQTFEGYKPIYG